MLVLAACSPVNYGGEQTARAMSYDSSADSAAFRSMIDQVVHDELQNKIDIKEWLEQTTVEEAFSAPDGTGVQHVTSRKTTTVSKRSETNAESSQTKDEKYQEQEDSIRYHSTVTYIEKEEDKKFFGKSEGFLPWYIYAVALVGAILFGIWLGLHKGWFFTER